MKRCGGICELCKESAPFFTKYGDPYLESHHVTPLSAGGVDHMDNIIALCPNCHRKVHYLAGTDELNNVLKEILIKCNEQSDK